MGNKVLARKMAAKAGVPDIPGTAEPITKLEDARAFCEKFGFPVMLKAAHGGGGRGMREVFSMDELENSFDRAVSESRLAFGSGDMFIEKLIIAPRHIEVQMMGDKYGNVTHFFERDCSVQRRHQKVIEIAPAPYLDPKIRNEILDHAVRLCKSVGYENAGTVEFLVDKSGSPHFIEVNARLQVEHTVTEQLTGVDLVKAQLAIAAGASLPDLGLTQDKIQQRGAAIQVRVTTENPAEGFRPDTGRITRFEVGEGPGIRIDSSCIGTRHLVTPHYDSLLCKVTATGSDHIDACAKLARSLDEFVIDGLHTNVKFLHNIVTDPGFRSSFVTTHYLEKNPQVFKVDQYNCQQNLLLRLLGDMTVNGPCTPLGTELPASKVLPFTDYKAPQTPPQGLNLKYILDKEGPAGFAKAVRQHNGCLLMDTTWRDAHQSLLATRVRTQDILAIADQSSHLLANCYSLENWGGATFDVALRFLKECPWERLALMRERVPNIPFQMLLRGANTVGYKSYPDNIVRKSVKLMVQHGMDVFRIFDSLNYMPNLQIGIDAVGEAGGVVEAAICYTGDVSDPMKTKYNLDYYMDLATKLVNHGIHVLCIKDMAGVLKPEAARILIGALRKEFPDIPIHVHTHDTSGAGVAAMVACARAGADAVDAAIDSMSGLTSQPSMGAIVASLQGTELDTGISLDATYKLSNYWEMCREQYAPFECTVTTKATSAEVYEHEIPGGQYTNLQFQAFSLGLLDQWPLIKKKYSEANIALGNIVKVTPSSKVVGDLAQYMVANKLSIKDIETRAAELSFPRSVIDFLQGGMGQPYKGYPAWRDAGLKGAPKIDGRPGDSLPPFDFDAQRKKLEDTTPGRVFSETDVMSSALYPDVFDEYVSFTNRFGDGATKLPTAFFFNPMKVGDECTVQLAPGNIVKYKLLSVSAIEKTTGKCEVVFEMNGQPVFIQVEDRAALKSMGLKERADSSKPGSIGAPMMGDVVGIKVNVGDKIKRGQPLVILSAMKLETTVTSLVNGTVTRINVQKGEHVSQGDLVLEVDPAK